MRAPESVKWAGVDATPDDFTIYGGVYVLAVVATWGGGSVVVNKVMSDGGLAPTHTALTDDGITDPLYLPPGQYQLTITTATGVTADLTRVPFE